jgi:hypothetical protein
MGMVNRPTIVAPEVGLCGSARQAVDRHLHDRMALIAGDVREAALDFANGLIEVLPVSAGQALARKLVHQKVPAPSLTREHRIDPLVFSVMPDASPHVLRQDWPRRRRLVLSDRRIELGEELFAEELAHVRIERGERYAVQRSAPQRHPHAACDDGARDDHEAMKSDREAWEARRVAGVDECRGEVIRFCLNGPAKRLAVRNGFELAPHPPARPPVSEDAQSIAARAFVDRGDPVGRPGPFRERSLREPAAIREPARGDAKPSHDAAPRARIVPNGRVPHFGPAPRAVRSPSTICEFECEFCQSNS